MADAIITHDAPGVYFGQRERLSNSGIKELLRCPARFKAMMDGEEEEKTSPALLLGSLFHAMTLEPESVAGVFARRQNPGNTKAGKEEAAAAAEKGVTLVSPDMWAQAEAMAESARANPFLAAALKDANFEAETSIYWDQNGVPCKARLDGIAEIPGFGRCVIDLKSTTDASPEGIGRHMADFGYHRQAAWYSHAMAMVERPVQAFVFVFVEKDAPYVSTAVTVAEDAIGLAHDEIRRALRLYAECTASGVWPGYTSDIITTIDLPAYAYRRAE